MHACFSPPLFGNSVNKMFFPRGPLIFFTNVPIPDNTTTKTWHDMKISVAFSYSQGSKPLLLLVFVLIISPLTYKHVPQVSMCSVYLKLSGFLCTSGSPVSLILPLPPLNLVQKLKGNYICIKLKMVVVWLFYQLGTRPYQPLNCIDWRWLGKVQYVSTFLACLLQC